MTRTTRTYAKLAISEAAYLEIREKLERAGYADQFIENRDAPANPIIDMHGIALVAEVEMVEYPDQEW